MLLFSGGVTVSASLTLASLSAGNTKAEAFTVPLDASRLLAGASLSVLQLCGEVNVGVKVVGIVWLVRRILMIDGFLMVQFLHSHVV